MNTLKQLHWPLIVGLGALALIRPVLSMTGLMDGLGRPFGPVLITILISLAWLTIVVLVRARQPVLTLICAGISYSVFAIVISAVMSPVLTGQLSGPLTNPIAVVAVLITNAIWGALVGMCALAVQAITPRAHV